MNKKSRYAFIHIQPIAKWCVHECCWVTLALGLCFLHTRTHQVMSLGLRGPRGYKNISGFGVRLEILELGIGPVLFQVIQEYLAFDHHKLKTLGFGFL